MAVTVLIYPACQQMLDIEPCPPPYSSCCADQFEDPPPYSAKCSSKSKHSSKLKHVRKSLHRHKYPGIYDDLPIFENPCPICQLKYYKKAFVNWIRKYRNTLIPP